MKRRGTTLAILTLAVGVAACAGNGFVRAPAPLASAKPMTSPARAGVVHGLISHDDVRADLYLPTPGDKPAPWLVFAHERGWPAPDEKERVGPAIADALQRRGIAVAVVSFGISDAHPFPSQVAVVAEVVKELAHRSSDYGLVAEPVLAGDELGASLVAELALDPKFGLPPTKLRGVIDDRLRQFENEVTALLGPKRRNSDRLH